MLRVIKFFFFFIVSVMRMCPMSPNTVREIGFSFSARSCGASTSAIRPQRLHRNRMARMDSGAVV